MQKKLLFLDGLMIPATETFVRSLAPGILTGRGVFETMRVYEGEIFAVYDHLKRLQKGLSILKIKLPCSKKKINEYLYSVLRSNKLKNARLRLMIWRSKDRVRISIITSAYRPYSKAKYRHGFKAVVSDIRRDEESRISGIKSINYLPLLMARRKAKAKGGDEAILLNRKGNVAEGSYTNIFFVKDKVLFTPSVSCGCLNGITRQYIIKLARKLKIRCKEKPISINDLFECDEAFLTSSLIEVMPLTFISEKSIGNTKIGPVTKKFSIEYKNLVNSYSAQNQNL